MEPNDWEFDLYTNKTKYGKSFDKVANAYSLGYNNGQRASLRAMPLDLTIPSGVDVEYASYYKEGYEDGYGY